jgi:diketogulonate reductase-like aldo/keto reductase
MEELVDAGGQACATNQILYNVARRGPEFDLLPWMAARGMPAMAYSPIDHMRLPKRSVLDDIARERGLSAVQVALAWVLAQPQVCAIPKAGSVEHVRANREAVDVALSTQELAAIDEVFKPPRNKVPLEML